MEYFSYNNLFDELIKTLIRPSRQIYSLVDLGDFLFFYQINLFKALNGC
jgi:hypothetical protein